MHSLSPSAFSQRRREDAWNFPNCVGAECPYLSHFSHRLGAENVARRRVVAQTALLTGKQEIEMCKSFVGRRPYWRGRKIGFGHRSIGPKQCGEKKCGERGKASARTRQQQQNTQNAPPTLPRSASEPSKPTIPLNITSALSLLSCSTPHASSRGRWVIGSLCEKAGGEQIKTRTHVWKAYLECERKTLSTDPVADPHHLVKLRLLGRVHRHVRS